MRASVAAVVSAAVAVLVTSSAGAKTFVAVAVVGADGRSAIVRAPGRVVHGLFDGTPERPRGGYVRIYPLAPSGHVGAPGRFYPPASAVCLSWNQAARPRTCSRPREAILRRLAAVASGLERFHGAGPTLARLESREVAPTVLPNLRAAFELAFDRVRLARWRARPTTCIAFSGRWRGRNGAERAQTFCLSPRGAFARGRLFPLGAEPFRLAAANLVTTTPPARPLLGTVVRPGRGLELARLDADSYRPFAGPRVRIGRHGPAWSFSPDWSRLALGGDRSVRLVDVRRMRLLGDVRIDGVGYVVATWWPQGGRLFALQQYEGDPWRQAWLVEVDPRRRRVVRRTALLGSATDVARTRRTLLALLAPARTLGPARLLSVASTGRMTEVPLPAIRAGREWDGRILRVSRPALVTDRAGRRAFVLAGWTHAAVVNLRTSAVTSVRLHAERSLRARFLDWLSPPAWAKTPTAGLVLEGVRVTEDVVAVAGWNGRVPAGAKLVDLRRGVLRSIDAKAWAVASAGGIVLTSGERPHGVHGYDARGRLLWTRLRDRNVTVLDGWATGVFVLLQGHGARLALLSPRSGAPVEGVAPTAARPFLRREGSGWE